MYNDKLVLSYFKTTCGHSNVKYPMMLFKTASKESLVDEVLDVLALYLHKYISVNKVLSQDSKGFFHQDHPNLLEPEETHEI